MSSRSLEFASTSWCAGPGWSADPTMGTPLRLYAQMRENRHNVRSWDVSAGSTSGDLAWARTRTLVSQWFHSKRDANAMFDALEWLLTAPGGHRQKRVPRAVSSDLGTLPLHAAVPLHQLGPTGLWFFRGQDHTLVRAEGVHPEWLARLEALGFIAIHVCPDIDGFIGFIRS